MAKQGTVNRAVGSQHTFFGMSDGVNAGPGAGIDFRKLIGSDNRIHKERIKFDQKIRKPAAGNPEKRFQGLDQTRRIKQTSFLTFFEPGN
jgi:hypothetical protein